MCEVGDFLKLVLFFEKKDTQFFYLFIFVSYKKEIQCQKQ